VARQRQKNEPKECDCTKRSLKPDSVKFMQTAAEVAGVAQRLHHISGKKHMNDLSYKGVQRL